MKPVHLMNKWELVRELTGRHCRVTVHFASHRHRGKRIAWWYEYWLRFPSKVHLPQRYERNKKFKNHTQALRHALGVAREIMLRDWHNNSP